MQNAPRPNVTSHDINSAVDSLGAPPTGAAVPQAKAKYFGKTKSVHGMMGGGQLADVLLWRKWHISAAILGVAGVMWLLFEWSGYTLLTLLANTALIIVAAVFVWAQAAHFLNRSPPPLPEIQLTEEHVQWAATTMRREVNNALATAHSVAMGRDYRQVFKILFVLYIIATVGSWFNTLSLIFLSVLLLFTVPVFYEKYEEHVDAHLQKGLDELHRVWMMAEEKLKQVLHKIPRNEVKDKKAQ